MTDDTTHNARDLKDLPDAAISCSGVVTHYFLDERTSAVPQGRFTSAGDVSDVSHQIKENGCVSASVGGHIDHVHLFVGLSRTIRIAKLVEHIKTETSKWAKKVKDGTPNFSWQAGYGAFSVSHSLRDHVDQYVRNQARLHAAHSFQDEYRQLCAKHGIVIDERYVWD